MARAVTFEAWKHLLLHDCIAQEKEQAFNAIGDPVLKILFDSGLDPTVGAIVATTRIPAKQS